MENCCRFVKSALIACLCSIPSSQDSTEVTSPKLKSPSLAGPSQIPGFSGAVVKEAGTSPPSHVARSPPFSPRSFQRAHAYHGTRIPGDKRVISPKGSVSKLVRMSSGSDPRGTVLF